ncbi:MAG: nicotinamidase, partial [Verrucomicrobia bacterium]|nr:nicotinamidase [Verrucomicrobiota bacterium]
MGKKALVVVDVQNDFLPGGALGVAHGDEIIPLINQLVKLPFDVIVATKDF